MEAEAVPAACRTAGPGLTKERGRMCCASDDEAENRNANLCTGTKNRCHYE